MNIFSVMVPVSYGLQKLTVALNAEVLPDGISFVSGFDFGHVAFQVFEASSGGKGNPKSLGFAMTGKDAAALKCFGVEMQRRYTT